MMALQTSNQEWCQWGIGVGMDSSYGLHICRQEVAPSTFQVFIKDEQVKRAFGFFPIRKDLGVSKENRSEQEMRDEVRKFYETKAM